MPSLAEIILAGGQQRANTALRLADIEAERRTRNAAVWAGTANSLGQIGAQTIQTLGNAPLIKAAAAQKQKETELLDLQLQGEKDKRQAAIDAKANQRTIDTIMGQSAMPAPGVHGLVIHDPERFTQLAQEAGIDPSPYLPGLLAYNEKIEGFGQHRTDLRASAALQIASANYNPTVAVNILKQNVANGVITTQEEQQALGALKQSPEMFQKLMESQIRLSPAAAKIFDETVTGKPGDVTTRKVSGQVVSSIPEPPPKPPNSQSETFQLDGQTVKGDYLPGANGQPGRYFYNGQDVTNRAKAVPPASTVIQNLGAQANARPVNAARPDPKTGNTIDPKIGLTPNAIYQDALTFAMRGALPVGSRSVATLPAQYAVRNTAAAIAEAAGVDLPVLKQEYDAASASTRALTQRYQLISASAQTANDNIAYALELSPNVSRTGAPKVNRFTQWLTSELGGTSLPSLSQFELAIYTAAREYAKVSTGSAASIAELSATASQKVDQLINAAQTPEQFKKVTEAMQRDMSNITAPLFQTIQTVNDVGPNLKRFLEFTSGGTAKPPLTAAELIKKYGGS